MTTELEFAETGFAADLDTDVLVVGAGAAGLAAAVSAARSGASVLLLEREARPAGTTLMSQGAICAAGSRVQREAGVEDSPAAFLADVAAKTNGTACPVIARLLAEHSGPTMDWLTDELGLPYAVDPGWTGFFGHSINRLHTLPTRSGAELSDRLAAAAEAAGVTLVTSARVARLVADASGRVLGAVALRPDGREERVACRAFVATTCGFAADAAMVRAHIPAVARPEGAHPYNAPEGADGCGIRWGMALGAATGSMNAFQGYGALTAAGPILNYDVVMKGGVQVNAAGARFSDELADISGQSLKVLAQPGGEVWTIWDETRHETTKHLPEYRDLMALGAIKAAADLPALAALTGCPEGALAATLATAAAAAEGRAPDPFGRDFRGAAALAAPFRAAKVTGALFHTQGGLQLDAEARVVRPDGSRLPNFLAAGGTARGPSGDGASGYLPAAGLASAVVLGRLAGLRAAEIAATTAPAPA